MNWCIWSKLLKVITAIGIDQVKRLSHQPQRKGEFWWNEGQGVWCVKWSWSGNLWLQECWCWSYWFLHEAWLAWAMALASVAPPAPAAPAALLVLLLPSSPVPLWTQTGNAMVSTNVHQAIRRHWKIALLLFVVFVFYLFLVFPLSRRCCCACPPLQCHCGLRQEMQRCQQTCTRATRRRKFFYWFWFLCFFFHLFLFSLAADNAAVPAPLSSALGLGMCWQ